MILSRVRARAPRIATAPAPPTRSAPPCSPHSPTHTDNSSPAIPPPRSAATRSPRRHIFRKKITKPQQVTRLHRLRLIAHHRFERRNRRMKIVLPVINQSNIQPDPRHSRRQPLRFLQQFKRLSPTAAAASQSRPGSHKPPPRQDPPPALFGTPLLPCPVPQPAKQASPLAKSPATSCERARRRSAATWPAADPSTLGSSRRNRDHHSSRQHQHAQFVAGTSRLKTSTLPARSPGAWDIDLPIGASQAQPQLQHPSRTSSADHRSAYLGVRRLAAVLGSGEACPA